MTADNDNFASGSAKNGCHGKDVSTNTTINHSAKNVRKPNKYLELPVITNLNPRSAYNKRKEETVDILFMSESWERENFQLQELIHLENHTIISNVFQRQGKGGKPALFVNNQKYHV